MNKAMKILITGGCGFIGSNLVRHLIDTTDHVVINVDKLTYAGNEHSIADVAGSERYTGVVADIADAESVGSIFADVRPDAVMHLAAESHVDRSIDGPSPFVQTNIVGTFNLLEASLKQFRQMDDARRSQFRFHHISTDEVYGSLGDEGLFREDTRYDPHSPYSATKAASDHLVRAWHSTYGLPVLVTNCSNNFGPYQFPEKLLPLMIIKCLGGDPLPVYGRGENVRDWLYVQDHVEALLTVLERGRPGETYNIGGNNEMRNIDLVRSLCRIMDEVRPTDVSGGHASRITHVDDRPGHDFRYAIDAEKIHRELGWRPRFDGETALRSTIDWYLNHRSWWQSILDGNYRLQRLGT